MGCAKEARPAWAGWERTVGRSWQRGRAGDEETAGDARTDGYVTMNNRLTERQQAFLDAYRYSGMVKEAAETIGCSRELHYGAMRTSEAYREAFALVQCDVAVELEEEARRRAVDGVKVPIVFRGKVVGYDTRHSDALLIFLLEANHPEKFAGIKEELSRNKDFGVRWDREEVGRPTLSRMTGPMPPMPPRPPRPPQPPAVFWHQTGDCGEAIATPSEAGVVAPTPPDADVFARWGTAVIVDPLASVWNEAVLGADDAPAGIDDPGSGDSDDGFCVRSTPDETEESSFPPRDEWAEPSAGPDENSGSDGATSGNGAVPRRALPRRLSNERRRTFDHALSRACHTTRDRSRERWPPGHVRRRPSHSLRERGPPRAECWRWAKLTPPAPLPQRAPGRRSPLSATHPLRRPGPAERWFVWRLPRGGRRADSGSCPATAD